MLGEFHKRREDSKSGRHIRDIPLVPPGKIVQLVKTADDAPPSGCFSCCDSSEARRETPYAARWAQANDFCEIIISSHCLDDHSTVNVLGELERTAAVFGLSPPYTIQDGNDTSENHRPRRFPKRSNIAASLFHRPHK